MRQVDKLRELFAKYGDREAILIREYAAAERRGEVTRKSNVNNVSPEDYAAALVADARRKGWVEGLR